MAEVAQVDALDEAAVELSLADFERPVHAAVRATFLTSRAVARHMVRQGSGVMLTFGGAGGRDPLRHVFSGGYQGIAETLTDEWREAITQTLAITATSLNLTAGREAD